MIGFQRFYAHQKIELNILIVFLDFSSYDDMYAAKKISRAFNFANEMLGILFFEKISDKKKICLRAESDRRPFAYKANAITTMLRRLC